MKDYPYTQSDTFVVLTCQACRNKFQMDDGAFQTYAPDYYNGSPIHCDTCAKTIAKHQRRHRSKYQKDTIR